MENKRTTQHFASISTNDGKYRVWFSRPTQQGQQIITCSFSLQEHPDFVEAINQLDYLSIMDIQDLGSDMCHIYIQCNIHREECMCKLFEDLPSILEECLGTNGECHENILC